MERAEERTVGAGVRPFVRPLPLRARILGWIGRMGFRVLFRTKVKGLENACSCPPGTVVIANHVSYLDAAALAVFLPFEVTFAVNAEIARRWWVRIWLGVFRAVPVSANRASALKELVRAAEAGRNVMIFPEGRITVTGGIMRVWRGALKIAECGSGLIVPVGIEGAADSVYGLDPRRRRRWFPKVTLTVGEPQAIPSDLGSAGWLYDRMLGVGLDEVRGEALDARLMEKLYSLHRYRHLMVVGLTEDCQVWRAVDCLGRSHSLRIGFIEKSAVTVSVLDEMVYRERSECVMMTDAVVRLVGDALDSSGWDSVRRIILVGGCDDPDFEFRLAARVGCRVLRLPEAWDGLGWGQLPDPWIAGRRIGESTTNESTK